jgi:CheY-like chemotaxis protein
MHMSADPLASWPRAATRLRRVALARTRKLGKPYNLPLTVICALGESALANILIVDDDPAVQATSRIVLERAGHTVVVAGDGREGLAMFEAGDFDLLVLDIFMPGMDGLETMKLIHQRQPRIPILVISGRSMTSDLCITPDFLKMATKLGAISSLPKPFGPAEFLAAIAGCLEAAGPPPAASASSGDLAGQAAFAIERGHNDR